jgi:hypothetical protein
VEYMKKWFDEHSLYPYPTAEEMETIISATQLNQDQVRAWLYRVRTIHKEATGTASRHSESSIEYLKNWFDNLKSNPYPTRGGAGKNRYRYRAEQKTNKALAST